MLFFENSIKKFIKKKFTNEETFFNNVHRYVNYHILLEKRNSFRKFVFYNYTMWKFQNFSITHFLREIKVGDSWCPKTVHFRHIYNLWILIFMTVCTFRRLKFTKLANFRAPQNGIKRQLLHFNNQHIMPEIDFT